MGPMLVLAVLLVLLCRVSCSEVLVLVESPGAEDRFSQFLGQLQQIGLSYEIKAFDDPSIALKKYGEYKYKHLVLFAPSAEEIGSGLNAESVIEFIDDGGNVFLAASSNIGDLVSEIATENGVDADEAGTYVMDHLSFDTKDEGRHNLIVADPASLIKSERIVGKPTGDPLLFRGLGFGIDASNPLVLNVLAGSATAYSHNPEETIKEYPHVVGRNIALIAGLQARNNARVIMAGSLEFFTDEFFSSRVEVAGGRTGNGGRKSGNAALSLALLSWCFHQTGVVRIDKVEHRRIGEASSPTFYTVNEECEFSLVMSEYVRGAWVPFKGDDVQMELVRIDPFVRRRMVNKNGQLSAKFKIPDVYGVFKFKVDYRRLGLTYVSTNTQISVHPLRHNQYERFIISAYPYYASAFSMMAGVFVFSIVFLHNKEEVKSKTE